MTRLNASVVVLISFLSGIFGKWAIEMAWKHDSETVFVLSLACITFLIWAMAYVIDVPDEEEASGEIE